MSKHIDATITGNADRLHATFKRPCVTIGQRATCFIIGHKWTSASIGPRTVAAIECVRCHTIRYGGPLA